MAYSMQGVYAPLPQSLSDSDSEKEISMDPICENYNPKISNFDSGYRENGLGNHFNNEVINIISKGPSKTMSTKRKVAFIFSIILCFLPIIVFLFLLPCSELNTCPVKISNWEYSEPDMELKGPINVVSGLYRTTLNLALLYKGSFKSEKLLKNGIISLMGGNGAVAWDFGQEVEPTEMNCNLIDVDNNGNFDCLVADERGLKAIETISGQSMWHANSEEEGKIIINLEFPVKLQDLNNDRVPELLSIYGKKSLLLISGRNGKALRNIKVPGQCSFISDLTLVVYAKIVSYTCKGSSNNSTKLYAIPLTEFPLLYRNISHTFAPMDFVNINDNNIYESGNRKLVIENDLKLCKMSLYNEKHDLLTSHSYKNCFIMNPKPFNFAPTQNNFKSLKGHTNGFIVKIWQWEEHYKKIAKVLRMQNKRSIPLTNSYNDSSAFYLREVRERVILITFNNTDIRLINASLTDVNQMCINTNIHNNHSDIDSEGDIVCQPDHKNQKDSLLVVDLDHDMTQELVSFYSSYEKKDDDWVLTSYLKIFRLEEELPKLYGSK